MNKKLICLFLSLCLIFCLCACGESKTAAPAATPEPELTNADFVGKWSATADISGDVASAFSTEDLSEAFGGTDVSAYINVADLKIPPVTLLMQLNDDNTFSMAMDDSCKVVIGEAVLDWIKSSDFEGLFTEILKVQCEQYGVTFEDMMTQLGAGSVNEMLEIMLGMPLDAYLDELGEELSMDDFDLSEYTANGSWDYASGKLSLTTADGVEELAYDRGTDTITEPGNGSYAGDLVFSRS